jgi:hypothetical protein
MSFLEHYNLKSRRSPIYVGLVVLLGLGISLSEKEQFDNNTISIGEVTCKGAESFQFEDGSTIAEIADNIETDSEFTDTQIRDLRSIVNKLIVSEQGESVLSESTTPTDGIFGTELNQTININLPSNCQAYNFPL